jgi:Asp-tRNA(Asn)/Glu-tRNA(Gln) amidotransferase A subunit family amidase
MSAIRVEGELRNQIKAVAEGRQSVRSIVEKHLATVSEREPDVMAFVHLAPDKARAAADKIDAQTSAGSLRGLVFAAKDNFDTHDMPTGYGSAMHANAQPTRDASSVAELRGAGALLLGKTVSTEFAHRHPGPTRNPHDLTRTPGGSSSGSGAAVSAGMASVAYGSQTTGSVIRPAAYCGVVGYKPTYGEINGSGMLANTPSFDTVGLFSRELDALVLTRHALLGDDAAPLAPPSIKGLRVAFSRTPWWDEADAEARALTEAAVAQLASAGATVTDYPADQLFAALEQPNRTISGFEFARTLAHERFNALSELSPILRDGRMADGLHASFGEYLEGLAQLEKLRAEHDALVATVDVIVTPPAPGAAPVGLDATGPATFNMPWTTLHVPAVTLPVLQAANGMPVGLQVCAARHRDRELLAASLAIWDALDAQR